MAEIKNGTICMVLNDCVVDDLRSSSNIRGHLVYGEGVFAGPMAHVMSSDGALFTVVECRSKDLISIDPTNLDSSLSSAYRKSNSLLSKVPLLDLKQEYARYEEHFSEHLARRD